MVFIASSRHPLWRVVRRSMQLLTGAVMLTAVLGSAAAPVLAAQPPEMTASSVVSTAVNPLLELESSAVASATPSDDIFPVAASRRPAPVALTVISVLSGRLLAAALGERAPPRL